MLVTDTLESGYTWNGVETFQQRKESRVFHRDSLSSLGMDTESEERPQKVVCYGAGCEAGALRRGRVEI